MDLTVGEQLANPCEVEESLMPAFLLQANANDLMMSFKVQFSEGSVCLERKHNDS